MAEPIPKHPALKSKKLRESARGQECTLHFTGICSHDTNTTVLAHLRELSPCGIGMKPHDLSGVYACRECHDLVDRRNYRDSREMDIEGIYYVFARAIVRTHEKMLELGVLKL